MPRVTSRAWFIIPAAFGLLLIWTLISARSSDSGSSSYEGRDAAVVTLVAPNGGGREAAPRVVERLVALGIDAEVVAAAEDRIRIALRRVADPAEAIRAAAAPEPLSLHVVDERAQAPDAQSGDPKRLHPWLTGTSRADLRARIERGGTPPEQVPLVECVPGPDRKGPSLCAAWLGTPARIGSRQIQEVHLSADERTEEPLVQITFTPQGTRAFAELTREAAGKMLVVLALGEVQARPRIDAPIPDGRWTFSTRTGDTSRPVAIQRARRIAAAVKLPSLPPLAVETVEAGRAAK